MPSDCFESPHFRDISKTTSEIGICFSTYQRELNKLYIIASPLIELVFGIRTSQSNTQDSGRTYLRLATNISQELESWQTSLPTHLTIEFDKDLEPNTPMEVQVHRLQALSLRLTFDNLTIVLHRPFLAQQVDSLSKGSPAALHENMSRSSRPYPLDSNAAVLMEGIPIPATDFLGSSAEQWWNAAVQTSRITELPQLAQLATDSHLVAFLAINLFSCAVVMAVCALSDLLSIRAQEAKQHITRIYRLQDILGKRSTLPMQSTGVLKDLIRLLCQKEEEAMLAPVVGPDHSESRNNHGRISGSSSHPISVEDTLRVPLNIFGDSTNQVYAAERFATEYNATGTSRLNESLVSVQRGILLWVWTLI
jgi:hypothetical protein